MEFKDYYKVLGVKRSADVRAIRQAFRRLAREHHPDVSKARGAEERFKEINEAYQVLNDPQSRARYDQMYEVYQRGGVDWQDLFRRGGAYQQPGGFTVTFGEAGEDLLGGFSDFFRQFFGDVAVGRRGARRGRTGTPIDEDLLRPAGRPRAESAVEITLEEAFGGAHRPVSVEENGSIRRLDVTIPKGVRSGQRIRLPGALDGADLYLKVRVRPHRLFERRDDDIVVEAPVVLTEAMLGADIEVPTLEGKVTMKLPPETPNGCVFRLRGLGMPRDAGGRGDQLVRIKVVLPRRLSEDERKFFEEMRRNRPGTPRDDSGR